MWIFLFLCVPFSLLLLFKDQLFFHFERISSLTSKKFLLLYPPVSVNQNKKMQTFTLYGKF